MACEPVVRYTRRNPVFVVGYARSGTSLMCRLLLDYLRINFGTESQFIIRFYRRLARYGSLRDDSNIKLLIDDISRERFFMRTKRNFGFVLDAERAFRDLDERTYAAVLRSIFGQFAAARGLTRWGDKTPAYSSDLPVLLELFPDAQFVHVIRDGRDVARSVFQTHFGPKNIYDAAIEWTRTVRTIRQFGKQLRREQFMQIRYEDLLEDPLGVMRSIADFLGVQESDKLMANVGARISSHVRPNNSMKWIRSLRPRDIECFETVGDAELAHGGYPFVAPLGFRPVQASEILLWRFRGRCRRLSMRAYWADNLYRLRVRARELTVPLRTLRRS